MSHFSSFKNFNFKRLSESLAVWRAKGWLRFENAKFIAASQSKRHAFRTSLAILPFAIAASLYVAGHFEAEIGAFFDKDRLSRLSTLIVTVGGGLVGATAVAFSVVVFSVQVNVERTPDGLFQSLSRDKRLILMFVMAVLLSVACAALSVFVDYGFIGRVTVAATWSTLFVPCLIVYAYLRALKLINPHHQLRMLFDHADRYLKGWSKRADRLTPWVRQSLNPAPVHDPNNQFDHARALFFQSHPQWIALPGRAISQAMNYSRMYAVTGDSQVVGSALYTITNINRAYIAAKRRTFYSHNPLVNDNRSSDGVVTHTLEAYRQNIRNAVKRGDETEITQLLAGLGTLIVAYSEIQYPRQIDSSWYATLATGYLNQEVTEMLPHISTDVMMQSATTIGNVGGLFLRAPDLGVQQSLANGILGIAKYGLIHPKNSPATGRAMVEIAKIVLQLLRAPQGDAARASARVTQAVFEFAELVFQTPDTGITTSHAQYLSGYFGGGVALDMETFDARLGALVNVTLVAAPNHVGATRVIENLSGWSEELPQRVRRLLGAATNLRSRYSASIVWWIINISSVLYVGSTVPAADVDDRNTLKGRASWMLSAINFIPNDQQTVENMSAVDIAEQLLRMTRQLKNCGLHLEAIDLGKVADDWLIRTIPHTSADELAEGLFGLAALYADPLGAQAVNALTNKLRASLPTQPDYAADYRAAAIAQLNLHLQNVQTGRLDMMCYAEHYAENSPSAALRANVTSIVQAL
jgi:hypothetical protein